MSPGAARAEEATKTSRPAVRRTAIDRPYRPATLPPNHIAKRAAQTYNGATRFSSPQSSLWGNPRAARRRRRHRRRERTPRAGGHNLIYATRKRSRASQHVQLGDSHYELDRDGFAVRNLDVDPATGEPISAVSRPEWNSARDYRDLYEYIAKFGRVAEGNIGEALESHERDEFITAAEFEAV
jgi:hypothetical protein